MNDQRQSKKAGRSRTDGREAARATQQQCSWQRRGAKTPPPATAPHYKTPSSPARFTTVSLPCTASPLHHRSCMTMERSQPQHQQSPPSPSSSSSCVSADTVLVPPGKRRRRAATAKANKRARKDPSDPPPAAGKRSSVYRGVTRYASLACMPTLPVPPPAAHGSHPSHPHADPALPQSSLFSLQSPQQPEFRSRPRAPIALDRETFSCMSHPPPRSAVQSRSRPTAPFPRHRFHFQAVAQSEGEKKRRSF
jgi:hypothetical protein